MSQRRVSLIQIDLDCSVPPSIPEMRHVFSFPPKIGHFQDFKVVVHEKKFRLISRPDRRCYAYLPRIRRSDWWAPRTSSRALLGQQPWFAIWEDRVAAGATDLSISGKRDLDNITHPLILDAVRPLKSL